tara:strand:+ start:223 stop:720 length:498 start_codon:yes stop_codon:yes gene_type:complete
MSPNKPQLRWNELLDYLTVESRSSFDIALLCKPFVVTRRKVEIYANLSKEDQDALHVDLRRATKATWNYTCTPIFMPFPEDGSIKQEQPLPDMVNAHGLAPQYPIDSKVLAHYPNDRLILTDAGVCRCKSARDYRIGSIVEVYRDSGKLFLKNLRRKANTWQPLD